MSTSPQLKPVADRWSGPLVAALFVVASVIVFYLAYDLLPANQHYGGLITIGVLALVFALGCYLGESFSRQPTAQRALAWGYFGMGFAVLFLSIALGPSYGAISMIYQLVALLITVVALIVAVALIGWRGRAVRATQNQQVPREAWRKEPAPSAFSYAAANSPGVPEAAPPTSVTPPSPPPGRP